jgi:hypothetical protein
MRQAAASQYGHSLGWTPRQRSRDQPGTGGGGLKLEEESGEAGGAEGRERGDIETGGGQGEAN